MADKLKLSSKVSEQLTHLSHRLNLRRNIICRIAIGKSFSMSEKVSNNITNDTGGYELNKSTIMGSEEYIFKAIATQIQNRTLEENEFFNIIIRNHIERGISHMFDVYEKMNSPVEFVKKLISEI